MKLIDAHGQDSSLLLSYCRSCTCYKCVCFNLI